MDTTAIDQAILELQDHKNEWASLPLPQKIDLLQQIRRRLGELASAWVEASVRGKGMTPASPEVGEEWTAGPWTLAAGINGYLDTLLALNAGLLPQPKKVHTRPDGQVAAQIFPNNIFDTLLLNGITAEVWMQPGVTEADLAAHTATFYRQKEPRGKVALVLGAGNVAGIPPRDVLYRLYGLGQVVMLKMSPVNDYLGPIFEDLFEPFVRGGFLRFAYGGREEGDYLVHHAVVETVHMTGSVRTFEAIVFGSGPVGAERKRRNEPVIDKPVTGELGGVSPTIVVPGKWSRADIRFQAENVVTMKMQNAGFNCVASQVLVLAQAWPQREEFLEAVRKVMRELPKRKSYYPGAAERQRAAVAVHPEAETLGGQVPITLITGLDPQAENEYCYQTEFFGPVFSETGLPGEDAAEFLANAVNFCNNKLYGTLGATLIVHPKTQKALGLKFEQALTDLHYGSIGVNIWNAAAFLLVQATWGGFPGHTYQDVQSGIGIVGNSFLFEKPERTVVRGSFYPFPRTWLHGDPAFLPKPPWFLTNRTAHITTAGVAKITIDPKFRYLPAILLSALRG
jgi:aldehyde dehydrogenase (NAD(P)+)